MNKNYLQDPAPREQVCSVHQDNPVPGHHERELPNAAVRYALNVEMIREVSAIVINQYEQ